jgi:V/A-type H+/Na+-transporting ATPase subunit I
MSRVALVAPRTRLRQMLVVAAESGCVAFVGPLAAPEGEAVEALRRLERANPEVPAPGPSVVFDRADIAQLERDGRRDLLAGEVELARRAASAVRRGEFGVLVGWVPSDALPALREQLAAVGAAAVELPRPRLVEPPILLRTRRTARPFRPLVDTYGATRYADIDPTPFAAASFVLMFGMMFGDVGHGLLLVALGLLLRRTRAPRWASLRPLWPFAVAGGVAAAVFGVLYGEAFGPTGLSPLWLAPLDEPVVLLGAALGVGAALLAVSYALGIRNRWREAGGRAALLAPSGVAGLAVFAAAGLVGLGVATDTGVLIAIGAAVAGVGVLLLFAGFLAESGLSGASIAEAAVEVLDGVIRVGANAISFTRLAAFGLMHAALGAVVLDGARSLWEHGAVGAAAAALVFAVGNAAAFALEALVAGVQALRLEYYELFSRVFSGEGERFVPWSLPVVRYGGRA